jgi:hypothetical protein
VLGTVLQHVAITDGRIDAIDLASRYGNVQIRADGFVDASGDAALTWQAGLPCWVPERTIYGSQQVIVENVDENHQPDPGEIDAVLAARGDEYSLLRRGGLAFFFPGRGTAVLNVTHIEAPLDPVRASQAQFDGRDQADRVIALLKAEFPPGVRRGPDPGLRLSGPSADPLDQGPPSADRRRGAPRHPVRRRRGPNGLADRAA